ncbi:UNVERIFIED_CONTAM: hypothetical protein GTU68_060544, partial [Idotea baltica]|nr:hypothetical protein [Idotea baltica]
QIIAFDELKTDYKNPIDQCNSLNPVSTAYLKQNICIYKKLVLPEYGLHLLFNILFAIAGEWLSLFLNIPLIGYHIERFVPRFCLLILITNSIDTT